MLPIGPKSNIFPVLIPIHSAPIQLISEGADLPLLLIFVGVVGGLIAFGIIGLFVGPVVLAVAHKLLSAWVDEEIAELEPASRQVPLHP
jgi:predicted PurR-regulated permease PerM